MMSVTRMRSLGHGRLHLAELAIAAVSLATLGLVALTGCQPKPSGDSSAVARAAPTLEELRNATYVGLEGSEDTLTLRDGRWEDEPPSPESHVRPSVTYLRDMRLAGDLDGDGAEEAVAFLAYSGGGTGDFLHVAVVSRREGRLRNVATALVGDRVQVRGARIERRSVALDLVQAGPGDAACCPGELVTRAWVLDGTSLVERDSVRAPARLSPEAIGRGEWTLEAWDLGVPADREPRVTIRYQDGRVAGISGCNRYSAPMFSGETPGDVIIGVAIGTRMACPPPAMEVERRFLDRLAGTRKIGFIAGRLALTYREEQGLGTMLFTSDSVSHAGPDSSATR